MTVALSASDQVRQMGALALGHEVPYTKNGFNYHEPEQVQRMLEGTGSRKFRWSLVQLVSASSSAQSAESRVEWSSNRRSQTDGLRAPQRPSWPKTTSVPQSPWIGRLLATWRRA